MIDATKKLDSILTTINLPKTKKFTNILDNIINFTFEKVGNDLIFKAPPSFNKKYIYEMKLYYDNFDTWDDDKKTKLAVWLLEDTNFSNLGFVSNFSKVKDSVDITLDYLNIDKFFNLQLKEMNTQKLIKDLNGKAIFNVGEIGLPSKIDIDIVINGGSSAKSINPIEYTETTCPSIIIK